MFKRKTQARKLFAIEHILLGISLFVFGHREISRALNYKRSWQDEKCTFQTANESRCYQCLSKV